MKPFPASSADWSDADAAGRSAVPVRSRLHPTVLLMACAHMMVDGYGNIYAPLLPLLIPRLDLTLAAAGTLTMLFQLSASVAQIGFGEWTGAGLLRHPRYLGLRDDKAAREVRREEPKPSGAAARRRGGR